MSDHPATRYLQEYLIASQPYLESYLQSQIEEARRVGGVSPALVGYFREIAQGGKRIRGALMQLGYQICGGRDLTEIIRTSICVECLHGGFLVQDDVMDEDVLRRGHEALHIHFAREMESAHPHANSDLYGMSMAICAGDIAYFYAYDILAHAGFAPEAVVRACQIMSRYAIRVGYGQAMDVSAITSHHPTAEEVISVMRYKTAEYTGVMPLLMGATLAGERDGARLQALVEYGIALGWAFQIQDDILGTYGDLHLTGKPTDSDIRKGKHTLLIQAYRQRCTSDQVAQLARVLGNPAAPEQEVHQLATQIRSSGALDEVMRRGWDYVEQGLTAIPAIGGAQTYRDTLAALIRYMMERVR